ncbi:MAG: dephospho-CoA kinase [Actinomycetota bacterium]|nr:dephospho-CoA kinase [Actinomycetota bacterium]
MLRVGLTGGIGSGKSEVSRRLAAHGAVVVDADLLAREVVEPGTAGLDEVVAQLGPEVLGPDGTLDRAAVGRRVFDDDAARRRLEAVIHPRVRQRAAEIERRAADGAVVVHDIPLLVETGQQDDFEVIVVVDAPDDVRTERLVSVRGMDADEARARIAAQASRERRLAAADEVVDNGGDRSALDAQVDALWQRLRVRAG